LLLAVPVSVFLGVAFVVALFTGADGDFGFDQVAFPIERGTHAGFALLGNGGVEFGQFLLIQ